MRTLYIISRARCPSLQASVKPTFHVEVCHRFRTHSLLEQELSILLLEGNQSFQEEANNHFRRGYYLFQEKAIHPFTRRQSVISRGIHNFKRKRGSYQSTLLRRRNQATETALLSFFWQHCILSFEMTLISKDVKTALLYLDRSYDNIVFWFFKWH